MTVQSRPISWDRCKHLFILFNPKRCRHCGEEIE
jgi:hypothetical protein